ncbi:MAG TPA: NAD-dependent epimerase/dehydratase family protein [Terriglobales bacterium]|jgi:nucleoside-diphosphate-sugar epimerase|nr:NAD-dependent epimerase/dehydratase family protein [Terriglobales bacterium]
MKGRIFLAGASGVIGRRLGPLLIASHYEVFGTTRSKSKADMLEAAGIKPVLVDVFDAPALSLMMATVQPDVVVHQLTDLAIGRDPNFVTEAIRQNARIRREGTANLVAAALAVGARRLIAQSIAWAYAAGPQPFLESAPLDLNAEGSRAMSVQGVAELERLTLGAPPLAGAVLRYGQLYGPATGSEGPKGSAPVHVDAAAQAALLAIDRAVTGIFNIAEDTGFVSIAKARRELNWDPDFRIEK